MLHKSGIASMDCLKCWLVLSGTICMTTSVKINMQGSISLGKEVLDTLNHYMMSSGIIAPNRRSMQPDSQSEKIQWIIDTSNLCRGIRLCQGPLGKSVYEYVVTLSNAVENILSGIISPGGSIDDAMFHEKKGSIFVDGLKVVLDEVNNMLKTADHEITKETEVFTWLTLVKSISAKFQDESQKFLTERLVGDPLQVADVKKKLAQKLIVAIIVVEIKYERRLCTEHSICSKQHECTNSLATLLGHFKSASNDQARDFIKVFYESLPESFYFFMDDATTNEFQYVLSELSYTNINNNTLAKEILLSIHKTIEARLETLKTQNDLAKGFDTTVIHVIMSDLDYFYTSKKKIYPFENFLVSFKTWLLKGGKISAAMRQVIREIGNKMSEFPDELLNKVKYQGRVFLELTVDPEK